MRDALPLAEAGSLARPARRTHRLRIVLALALVGLVCGAIVATPRAGGIAGIPAVGGSTVVVLDVSTSVVGTEATSAVARAVNDVLREVGPDGRTGLVVFSDIAETALPVGTPARELEPVLRFFVPPPGSAAWAPPAGGFARHPWAPAFSGGTTISSGLAAARRSLEHERGGRIVLISDLGDAPSDLPLLRRELLALTRRGISVRAIPLPTAAQRDVAFFRSWLGRDKVGVRLEPAFTRTAAPTARGALPTMLVVLAGAVALALAASELFAVSLRWRRTA
jgi:hypothetical protein